MRRPHGAGTDAADFVLLALDGLQNRIEDLQNQLDAIRRVAEDGFLGGSPAKKRGVGRPRKSADATTGLPGARKGHSTSSAATRSDGRPKPRWTPEMRAAAAARMRKVNAARWKALKAAKAKKAKRGTTKGFRWTPEQRAGLSAKMKAVYAQKAKGKA